MSDLRSLTPPRLTTAFLAAAAMLSLLVVGGLGWSSHSASRTLSQLADRGLTLQRLAADIARYDEILTSCAQLAAASGEARWRLRYIENSDKLDAALRAARELAGDISATTSVDTISSANDALVAIESRVFQLANAGRLADASAALQSDEYRRSKEAYAAATADVVLGLQRKVQAEAARDATVISGLTVLSVPSVALVVASWAVAMVLAHRQWQAKQREHDALTRSRSLESILAVQRELELERLRLQTACDGAGIGSWELERETNKLVWNDTMFSVMGVAREDFDGTYASFRAHVHLDDIDRVEAKLAESLDNPSGRGHCRFRMVGRDGATRHIEGMWVIVRDANKPPRLIGVNADVTSEVEAQERLERQACEFERARDAAQAASRAKSDFLANMSHEIRTPLTSVLGYADLLLDPDQTDEERTERVATIRRNAQHLLAVVGDILDFSKLEAGQMRVDSSEVSPEKVLRDVESKLRVAAQEKGLALVCEIEPGVPDLVVSDAVRLRQILLNLAGNAMKFTTHGRVEIRLGFNPDRGELRFAVSDTGIGITPEQRERLFQPFTMGDESMTRRFGGTGLGLTIAARLAAMLGGMIEVRSTPGLGSTFTLSLSPRIVTGPAAKTASNALASDEPTGPGPAPPPLTGRRILLAEDGIDNQRLIAFHLRRAGAEVEIAENGRVAIDRVVAAASAGQSFDVVLMDMQMPELDGYAATAQLREKGFRAPILALTAHALADDEDRCRMAGCDAHLTKPFDPPALVETILERTRNASGVRAAA